MKPLTPGFQRRLRSTALSQPMSPDAARFE
jgi:hypothetical protein